MNPKDRERAVLELFTLPAIPEQGRGRLVGVAMALFYYHGISPVGLDRILAETGVSKTTFYKHFESKDELVVATIEMRDAWQMDAWTRAVEVLVGKDPRDQLMAVLDVLDLVINEPEFRGCQFINAAAEFPNPHDPIHRAAVRHKQGSSDWFRELAERAGARNPEAFADAYTMLFEGALVLRQVHDRDDAAKAARPHVERLIDEFVPRR
jgi:AcrR family transcriptional regulator